MKYTQKTIKRSTKESAFLAAEKHKQVMTKKGWFVSKTFSGDAGCKYKVIVEFYKKGSFVI